MKQHRPHTIVVLAMSIDGKIADVRRSPARFGSKTDKAHLEKQIAAADAVIFGASTLRAYGTTLTVSHPKLLRHRAMVGKSTQPIHIILSASGQLNPESRFFYQKVPHWLITTQEGANFWINRPEFQKTLVFETLTAKIDIQAALNHLYNLGIKELAVLGGGTLVSSMVELNLIDEFWLTVCPLILGGETAPTPVEGRGFLPELAPKLELIEVETIEQEVFLHYRVVSGERR
jgi:5-amino-6-(5-phosphoribosylamino)uracil reductase